MKIRQTVPCLILRPVLSSALASIVFLGGCAHAPRDYVFSTPRSSGQALDVLARSLSSSGHRISRIDRKNTEITTYWEDTGYRFRETDDLEDETNVFLRFHVHLSDVGAEHRVTVRADVERCVPYRAVVTPDKVVSTCLTMEGILPTHQRALDELGVGLSAALSSPGETPMPSPPGRGG